MQLVRGLKQTAAPATEPVSLADAKSHLRITNSAFASAFTPTASIAPGNKAVVANFGLLGTSANVLGLQVVATVETGNVPAGASVTVKLQDSSDNASWLDVVNTTITINASNTTQTIAYNGANQYLRAVATVAGSACDLSVSLDAASASSPDDAYISGLITAARMACEDYTGRKFVTQTYDLTFDWFPVTDGLDSSEVDALGPNIDPYWYPFKTQRIELPLVPLQTVNGVFYTPDSGTEQTLSSTVYLVDANTEPPRIGLKRGQVWPTFLNPINGVRISFTVGYGSASSVPQIIKQAILLAVKYWYEHREDTVGLPPEAMQLLRPYKLMRI